MSKVIVLGSHGQLASTFRYLSRTSSHSFAFIGSSDINFLDTENLDHNLSFLNADWIINCMAYTKVDKAEIEKEDAQKINSSAVLKLAQHCQKKNISLIHISTDFVFDGSQSTPYTETDTPNPINEYGKTKLMGENHLQTVQPHCFIFRTSWLYSEYGTNFVHTITRLLKEKNELRIISDQIGSPTSCYDLALSLLQIIDKNQKPKNVSTFHYSNQGAASWYDFAVEIAHLLNINIPILPIMTLDYPTPAQRPHFSVMSKDKFCSTFETTIPHWRHSLEKNILKRQI